MAETILWANKRTFVEYILATGFQNMVKGIIIKVLQYKMFKGS